MTVQRRLPRVRLTLPPKSQSPLSVAQSALPPSTPPLPQLWSVQPSRRAPSPPVSTADAAAMRTASLSAAAAAVAAAVLAALGESADGTPQLRLSSAPAAARARRPRGPAACVARTRNVAITPAPTQRRPPPMPPSLPTR